MAARPEAVEEARTEPGSEGIAATARRVVAEASTLVRAEARLAELETRDNLKDAARVVARLAIGGAALGLGALFLVLLGLVALAQAIGWLPALGLVAAVHLLAGAWLLASGRRAARSLRLLPAGLLGRMATDLDRLAKPGNGEHRGGQDATEREARVDDDRV